MRIVHLTSAHDWFDTRIYLKMCRSLAAAGHDVHLVAPGDRCSQSSDRNGVRIHTIPRARNRWERILKTRRWIGQKARELRGDVYHFHDFELISVAARLKRLPARVVYDIHEDVPRDILLKDWLPRASRPTISRLAAGRQAVASQWLDGLVAATPAIARSFPPGKTVVVRNYPLRDELVSSQGRWKERSPLVTYIGRMTRLRGVCNLARAVARLPASLSARLAVAGVLDESGLEQELRSLVKKGSLDLLGRLNRDGVRQLLARTSVGAVTLLPTPTYVESLPIKLFEYMSAGVPVVASDFPLWREIIGGARCGVLVDPGSPTAIAAAIQWLHTHPHEAEAMGRRGRNAVDHRYHWEKEAEVLLEFYRELGPQKATCRQLISDAAARAGCGVPCPSKPELTRPLGLRALS